jgi:high-affinity Fe2+/Pb2+ permease
MGDVTKNAYVALALAVVSAAVAVAVAFGISLSDVQTAALTGFVTVFGSAVVAVVGLIHRSRLQKRVNDNAVRSGLPPA